MRGTFSVSGSFSVRGFLMAMGSAYGLLQIIVFLGYGLVNVPRQMFYSNSTVRQANMALCQVDVCQDRLDQTRFIVEDFYQTVLTLESKNIVKEVDLRVCLDEISAKIPHNIKDGQQAHSSIDKIDKSFRSGSREALV